MVFFANKGGKDKNVTLKSLVPEPLNNKSAKILVELVILANTVKIYITYKCNTSNQ
jgi:hypothetical protein